jgi:hypothetical protein
MEKPTLNTGDLEASINLCTFNLEVLVSIKQSVNSGSSKQFSRSPERQDTALSGPGFITSSQIVRVPPGRRLA